MVITEHGATTIHFRLFSLTTVLTLAGGAESADVACKRRKHLRMCGGYSVQRGRNHENVCEHICRCQLCGVWPDPHEYRAGSHVRCGGPCRSRSQRSSRMRDNRPLPVMHFPHMQHGSSGRRCNRVHAEPCRNQRLLACSSRIHVEMCGAPCRYRLHTDYGPRCGKLWIAGCPVSLPVNRSTITSIGHRL